MVFQGNGTALVTPFNRDGGLDIAAASNLIRHQRECGTAALIVCGTTGEGSTLTEEEREQLISLAVREADMPVIVGTGSNDTARAIALSRQAERLGANALLVVTPYYNKTSQAGLIRHFTMIADSVSIPIILYDVPSRTGMRILPNTAAELSKHELIVGLKAASGDISSIAETIALCGDAVAIYSGNDDQTLPILALGGVGSISVVSNIMPRECAMLCEKWRAGDTESARRIQLSLLPIVRALFSDVNPIPIKEAMRIMGCDVGECRPPLTQMDSVARLRLIDTLSEYSLI